METQINVISNIETIANFFLSKQQMTPKKLQKMCYYAYSWYLALFNAYLFDNGKFEAWVHGPVNRLIYDKYKKYGWTDIPMNNNVENIDDSLNEFLELIFDTFSKFDGNALEEMTHSEEPWINARKGLAPDEPSKKKIDDNIIKSFYQKMMEEYQVE